MNKNQKGFGLIEGLLILVILGIIGGTGWYVWRAKNNTDNNLDTASKTSLVSTNKVDPYKGWKTFSSTTLGVEFKYPDGWTITAHGPDCDNSVYAATSPDGTELSQAATTIKADLKKYDVLIAKLDKPSPKCAPPGNDFSNSKSPYIQSTNQITSGVFKDDWLTFFGSTAGNNIAIPDTGMVTNSNYSGAQLTFLDAGTIVAKDGTYQIMIETSSVVGQQFSSPVPMNIDLLKTTSLYKDTLNILNSVQ